MPGLGVLGNNFLAGGVQVLEPVLGSNSLWLRPKACMMRMG